MRYSKSQFQEILFQEAQGTGSRPDVQQEYKLDLMEHDSAADWPPLERTERQTQSKLTNGNLLRLSCQWPEFSGLKKARASTRARIGGSSCVQPTDQIYLSPS